MGEANGLLAENSWYLELGADDAKRQQAWQAFLLKDDSQEEQVEQQDWVVGSQTFRRRMRCAGPRPEPRGRGRPSSGP